jgi:hypothetical protein
MEDIRDRGGRGAPGVRCGWARVRTGGRAHRRDPRGGPASPPAAVRRPRRSRPEPGRLIAFHSVLTDTEGGDLGNLNIQCGVNFSGLAVCVGIFSIHDRGQLSVDALPEFPNPATGIVTGGNGDFRNARGEADIQPQQDGTTLITFHLVGVRAR